MKRKKEEEKINFENLFTWFITLTHSLYLLDSRFFSPLFIVVEPKKKKFQKKIFFFFVKINIFIFIISSLEIIIIIAYEWFFSIIGEGKKTKKICFSKDQNKYIHNVCVCVEGKNHSFIHTKHKHTRRNWWPKIKKFHFKIFSFFDYHYYYCLIDPLWKRKEWKNWRKFR